jgi:hypothetical protein
MQIIDECIVKMDQICKFTSNGLKNSQSNIHTMNVSEVIIPEGVIDGCLYTKDKRHELYGMVAGGSGSMKPEAFQRKKIEEGTGLLCNKTDMRINWRKNEMVVNRRPMCNDDGYDYTENFDGILDKEGKKIWINLKSVVGEGGSQTRALRDQSYHFVEAQLKHILSGGECFFANIFDGDEAAENMGKFRHLLKLPVYSSIKNVYVGDLKGFFAWFHSIK